RCPRPFLRRGCFQFQLRDRAGRGRRDGDRVERVRPAIAKPDPHRPIRPGIGERGPRLIRLHERVMDAFCGRVPSFETIAMIQYICLRAPSRSLALLRSANCLSFSQFMKSKVAALLTLLGVLLAGSPAQATSILLDFGSTTVLPADALKS